MKAPQWSCILATVILISFFATAVKADSYSDTLDIFKKSPAVEPFFKNAFGYAVFPIVGKGGAGIGGAYGKGRVYQAGIMTGISSLVKISFGFQLGGQVFSEIIFFQDQRAYNEFTSGAFEFDATASAVAITTGIEIQAGTAGVTAGASSGPATGVQAETKYRKGMAIFIHAKGGLMLEAVIGGQKFTFTPKLDESKQ